MEKVIVSKCGAKFDKNKKIEKKKKEIDIEKKEFNFIDKKDKNC